MNMHKNTRLTPHHRQAIWLAYTQEKESVTSLARRYQVSRVTIYRTLKVGRVGTRCPRGFRLPFWGDAWAASAHPT